MKSRQPLGPGRLWATMITMVLLTIGTAALAMVMGVETLDLSRALTMPESTEHLILWNHRIPRVLQGLAVGAILGASGAALQGLLANPLAEPFVLGVSGGAALGATCVALTGLTLAIAEPVGGFIGALFALVIVTVMSTRGGRVSPLAMLLVGVIFNAFAGSTLMILQSVADAHAVQRVLMRLMGSLAPDPTQPMLLPTLMGACVIGIGLTISKSRQLNLLGLGDDTAKSLGVDCDRLRRSLFIVLSIPIGVAVAVSGLIGFVGLIVPHTVRMLVGPDHRLVVPCSALGGAAILVLADGLVRILARHIGTELPVGVVTTFIGGPLFIWLLRQQRNMEAS